MPNYEVHYLDVSDADSIIIRYDDGRKQYIVLIDAGNVEDSAKIKIIFGITGILILLI